MCLEWIRNDPRFKDLPVVILTSSKEARDIARVRELGIMAYHVKPVDLKEFTELVKSIGHSASALSGISSLPHP